MDRKHEYSICIIAFSEISNDSRVLRQIKFLSSHYDLSVVGYGSTKEAWINKESIHWYPLKNIKTNLSKSTLSNIREHIISSLILILGRINKSFYDKWYWSKEHHRQAFEYTLQSNSNALLANDWQALPLAVKAANTTGAKLVFDSHEYAPMEFDNSPSWRILFRPVIVHFLKQCSSRIDASVAAWPGISERYRRELGLEPLTILNIPVGVKLKERQVDFNCIKLVHHGVAIRGRKLENMIKALALSHPRFKLHFILIEGDPGYLDDLKRLAEKLAPSRIFFENPIRPEEIVERISKYDIGFYLLAPTNYNNQMSIPNKLFDYIIGGLGLLIGPSSAMAKIVRQYGLGWVAQSFNPEDVAKILNQITYSELIEKRLAAREAAKKFNAETEMGKLLNIFDKLFNSPISQEKKVVDWKRAYDRSL